MKKFFVFLACLLLSQASFSKDEPDTRPPIDQYRGSTQFFSIMCKLSFELAQLTAESQLPRDEKSDYIGCIVKGKAETKSKLDVALKTVKKPKAQEALKTYHVAFITALEGVMPGRNEIKLSYSKRQQDLEGKMTEAWARFEVEQ